MIYCENCGKEVTDNSGICKQCGSAVPRLDGATIHNTINENYSDFNKNEFEQKAPYSSNKGTLVLFKVLSLLFPIVGLILFFCFKESDSKMAYACLRFAGFGILLNIIVGFILPLLLSAIFGFSLFAFFA